jgi:hypothetical protein
MIRLSETSKLAARSWSLQAIETCPGSIGADGALVAACSGCYATTGNYRYPNVKAPRIHNREDWQRPEWVADMVSALDADRYFRWFDSGDMYSLELAEKIAQVMRLTPWVKHWLPTRMAKFPKFRGVIAEMQSLPNVSVRFSSDSITGEHGAEHGSVIVQHAEDAPSGSAVCRAYEHGGKCNGCRACWNTDVRVIAYVAHGKKIAKQYKVINIFKG